jgi:hypothetical protein
MPNAFKNFNDTPRGWEKLDLILLALLTASAILAIIVFTCIAVMSRLHFFS